MLPQLRHPGDLLPLLELLPDGATVVELGVFAGDGTRQFLSSLRLAKIYCVDFWQGGYDDHDLASSADMVEAERQFDSIVDVRLVKLRMTLLDALARTPERVDLIYLDANHTYVSVRADLLAWKKKLCGGWMAGHDYGDAGHPDVRRAVDEVMGIPDHVFPDSSWIKYVGA